MTTRAQRWALRAYPPVFRERYGDELAQLVEDAGRRGPAVTADLLVGALRAWAGPAYSGDPAERRRLRLLSSVSTVWVGFCLVLCGTVGTLRLLEDPPAPGFDPSSGAWAWAHDVAAAALWLSLALVVAAAVPLGVRALRIRAVRRVVLGPVVALALLGAGFEALASARRAMPASDCCTALPTWYLAGAAAWLLASAGVAAWWTVAMPVALRRAAPSADRLRPAAWVSAAVVPLLLVPAVLVSVVAATHGAAWGPAYAAVVWTCAAAVVGAWACAATSLARGVPALLAHR